MEALRQEFRAAPDSFAACLREGLSQTPKEIACKYFYDAEGSALFDAICALPEYYQTRTEVALLRRHAGEIANLIGSGAEIVEFGAGVLRKVRILLEALEQPLGYMPIDISGTYLREVTRLLAADYPRLNLRPVVGDFTLPMHLPGRDKRAGFFPGSTIGNFRPNAAMALLRRMRETLSDAIAPTQIGHVLQHPFFPEPCARAAIRLRHEQDMHARAGAARDGEGDFRGTARLG
jgi:L-histidine N-alpha-methyltransferase